MESRSLAEVNRCMKQSHMWMYDFLTATEVIKKDHMPKEIQCARKVVYQHYSSLDDLWLDCDGDFLELLRTDYLRPYLTIHIHMALSLYDEVHLMQPFVNKIKAEKYRRYEERAEVVLEGKNYFDGHRQKSNAIDAILCTCIKRK